MGVLERGDGALEECSGPEYMVICRDRNCGANPVHCCHELVSFVWAVNCYAADTRVNFGTDSSCKFEFLNADGANYDATVTACENGLNCLDELTIYIADGGDDNCAV